MAIDDRIEGGRQLKLVGLWEMDPALPAPPSWLHPRLLVDDHWEADGRDQIVHYLKHGAYHGGWCGVSLCRFGCGSNGSTDLTDGEWLWPQGLAHYIEVHHVRLPGEFIAAMKQRDFQPPVFSDEQIAGIRRLEQSVEFWNAWCDQQSGRQD